ncbi:MAG: prepilin-type N-terminal cleavage/methylation domain-containing protein [Phycisphaeraceae bacterium]|nr:prepilin-type N-terminal cleavage/methylation domain-containing protein [Phycisphaeraceae bacterium]MCW5762804.1 prepilin-type N-terminal cleavage/methylation domain-containing protein [Phycisphaeraceae bacterium]
MLVNGVRRKTRGFTLVEILIVVVILGILAAIVVPQFTNAANDARAGNLRSQIKTIENQLELFRARTGAYPTLAQLQAAPTDATAGTSFGIMVDNDYLKTSPTNPVNGSQTVAAAAAATVGWHWDGSVFGASYFNETTGQITSDP